MKKITYLIHPSCLSLDFIVKFESICFNLRIEHIVNTACAELQIKCIILSEYLVLNQLTINVIIKCNITLITACNFNKIIISRTRPLHQWVLPNMPISPPSESRSLQANIIVRQIRAFFFIPTKPMVGWWHNPSG